MSDDLDLVNVKEHIDEIVKPLLQRISILEIKLARAKKAIAILNDAIEILLEEKDG